MPSTGHCEILTGSKTRAGTIVLALSVGVLLSAVSEAPRHGTRFEDQPAEKGVSDEFIVVRVLSSSDLYEIDVFANDSQLLITFDNDPSSSRVISRGERTTIVVAGARVQLRSGTSAKKAARINVASLTGHGLSIGGRNQTTRTYRGEMEFRADTETGTLTLLNRVTIEEYVSSVVASEYGLRDVEGAKAMAVVARTYALRSRAQRIETKLSGAQRPNDYDLLDDTRAQVYRGAQSVTDQSRRAALETAGETLFFEGALIQAVYSSSNGGKTAANESIWDAEPVPYLRGKDDPYDGISPHSKWQVDIDRDMLHEALSDRFGLRVVALQFRKPGTDGRIREVKLFGDKGDEKTIDGGAFRVVASAHTSQLKSTFFEVEERRDHYRFHGHGFGHGVGLSQWGAHGMALGGSTYNNILDFYYPGTTLVAQLPGEFDQQPAIAQANAQPGSTTVAANDDDADLSASGSHRVQLGWGGGWRDLHAEATSVERALPPSHQTSDSTTKSRKRRIGW